MKKLLFILLLAIGVSYLGWGQILTFEFSALAGNEVSAASNTNDANLTSSTITRGAGLTAAANGGRFNATSWALTSIDNAVSGNDYMEFTITPNSGYQFSVSSIYIQLQRSSTGPRGIALRNSVDGYSSNLDVEYAITDNTSTQNFTFSFAQSNSASAVTYRIYMWAEADGGTGGPGDGTGNDIVIYGITSSLGGNVAPFISNISQIPADAIMSSSTVSVSADVTDSDGTITGVELHWGTATGVLTNTIAMANGGSGDTYTTISDIPAQVNGTTVYYEVYAIDDDADFNTSPEQSYNVIDPASTVLPYSESFVADLGDCYPYSVSGATKYWIWNSGGYAYMSGYNSGETEEDWLVLPGINLNNYSNEFMTFDTWYQYGSDDANNYLKLYYSTDYFGVGNPSSATWTELPYTQPAASQVWTSSGYVDLTGISGTMVYIAFKYNYEVTKYRNWGLDNISIMEYDLVNWANLQWPGSGNITVGTTFNVYAQCWEPGVTDSPGQGAGITVWIGYSTTNTDPSTWSDWVPATYLGDVGNNDEYSLDLGLEILSSGIYYYASRFQLNTSPFQYGGFSGGFWDGVNNISGVLTVNPPSAQIDWANLQWPPNGIITLGGDFVVYAQVYEPGVTDLAGQGVDITAWIGYSTSNTDPSTWTDWVPAIFNVDVGLYDEYMANIGDAIASTGTIYYASRFKLGLADYVYGGYAGGFWDGINNVSGELTVNAPVIVINEVDSDTPSTDVLEFVELYDGGTGNTSLNGLVVVFYNGNNDLSYGAYDLDGYSTDANGYFVLGNSAVTNVDFVFTNGSLQNGQDAVALYIGDASSFPANTAVTTTNLLDALVYDNGQADDPGLLVLLNSGEPQINENGRSNGANHSCQRIPNGSGGQRNTNTYDEAFPTPGIMNLPVYTNWTGILNNNWNENGNWDYEAPSSLRDATIPDVAKAPFPVISGSATCANLTMNLGSTLEIGPSGSLTVTGTFINNGSLTIKSDASGTGSLIENNGVNATVERYYTGSEWHLISSPVSNATAAMFTGLYLQNHTESTNAYTDIVLETTPLNVMQGYALWNNVTETDQFVGTLNTGTIGSANNVTRSAPGGNSGWNLVGNPYPSTIDWDAASGWTKTNVDNATYVHVNNTTWASYVGGVGANGGSRYIASCQGFFVGVTDGQSLGTLAMNNSVRTNNTATFFKDEVTDILRLEVSGNGYTDETVIRFLEVASPDFDGQWDARKLFGITPEAPAIYSNINGMMAINSLPATNLVPVGVKAEVTGIFTIAATETSEFQNVILEDLVEGIKTDLLQQSYTFNYGLNEPESRFIVHFTPMAVPENFASLINIYSNNHDVYVASPANTNGTVRVFNLMGQEVANASISEVITRITLDKNAYYVVEVVGDASVVTKKVFIQ
jgi:hypothetical protein